VYLFLKEKTNIFSARTKLLHVAPERNLQQIFLKQQNVDYLSADLDSPFAMIKMDVTAIQFDDATFDAVICNHVLEHVPDDKKAMAEIYRVLKPDGWAILQVPLSLSLDATYENPTITSPEDREKVFGQKNHLRIYARDYKDRLEGVGFHVNEFEAVKELGADIVQRFALCEKENLYICSKD
jgi:SAM-dependent methyltransferase